MHSAAAFLLVANRPLVLQYSSDGVDRCGICGSSCDNDTVFCIVLYYENIPCSLCIAERLSTDFDRVARIKRRVTKGF